MNGGNQALAKVQYCIGKASRYKEGDTVTQVPFQKQENDAESQLRSNIYDDITLAKLACEAATLLNPVGFVVLKLETSE